MLIVLGNYFSLIRLAKTQKFHKTLSCFGYEKANMVNTWLVGMRMVPFLQKGTWQCLAKTACACPLTHTPLPGTHPKDPLQTKQKVLGQDYLLKLSDSQEAKCPGWERLQPAHHTTDRSVAVEGTRKISTKWSPGHPVKGKNLTEKSERDALRNREERRQRQFWNVDMYILINEGGLNRGERH